LRATALTCREPYVPSWAQQNSAAENVYGEQQSEYDEYAKFLQARDGTSIEQADCSDVECALDYEDEDKEMEVAPSAAEANEAAAKAAWLAKQDAPSWRG